MLPPINRMSSHCRSASRFSRSLLGIASVHAVALTEGSCKACQGLIFSTQFHLKCFNGAMVDVEKYF